DDRAGVAVRAQVLTGIETEGRGCAECTHPPSVPGCVVSLRAILDNEQLMLRSDRRDACHIGRLPVEVHRNDGTGPWRDRRLHQVGVYGVVLIDVYEHRLRPRLRDGLR